MKKFIAFVLSLCIAGGAAPAADCAVTASAATTTSTTTIVTTETDPTDTTANVTKYTVNTEPINLHMQMTYYAGSNKNVEDPPKEFQIEYTEGDYSASFEIISWHGEWRDDFKAEIDENGRGIVYNTSHSVDSWAGICYDGYVRVTFTLNSDSSVSEFFDIPIHLDCAYAYNAGVYPPETTVIGDVNGDGEVTVADATLIMQWIAAPDEYPLSDKGRALGDVTGGDGVTPSDALAIQQYLSGAVTALPIE